MQNTETLYEYGQIIQIVGRQFLQCFDIVGLGDRTCKILATALPLPKNQRPVGAQSDLECCLENRLVN